MCLVAFEKEETLLGLIMSKFETFLNILKAHFHSIQNKGIKGIKINFARF